MRKILLFLLVFLTGAACVAPLAAASDGQTFTSFYTGETISFDYTPLPEQGVVEVLATGGKRQISFALKKGGVSYYYVVMPGVKARLPLNMGGGDYTLIGSVYVYTKQVEDLWSVRFGVKFESELEPFLASSEIINWSRDMPAIETAERIAGGKTRRETAEAIAQHIIKDYKYYNYGVQEGYIPNLDEVYKNGSGVCYDFAAMYAAMCRSQGLPCKLLMGFISHVGRDEYHAWCEVYLDGKWVLVDPTYGVTTETPPSKTAWSTVDKVY